jgi:hypothetical protein
MAPKGVQKRKKADVLDVLAGVEMSEAQRDKLRRRLDPDFRKVEGESQQVEDSQDKSLNPALCETLFDTQEGHRGDSLGSMPETQPGDPLGTPLHAHDQLARSSTTLLGITTGLTGHVSTFALHFFNNTACRQWMREARCDLHGLHQLYV